MTVFSKKDSYNVYDLKALIALLRSQDGCPWDREQTHESIRRNFLEEAYEVCEAIDDKDPRHLCEELGDVLMQVVFHASIEEDRGVFDLDSVADMVCKKLVDRHPHIFSDVKADTSDKVLDNWDIIKMRERSQTTIASTMDSVAKSLPALWRADKVISKAEKTNLAVPDIAGALDKLTEKTAELRSAANGGSDAEAALGNVLFAAVETGRLLGVDPEYALGYACDDYIEQFRKTEKEAEAAGLSISELDRDTILAIYHKATSDSESAEELDYE